MICYECGHRIKGDFAKFCDHCGSSLEIKSKNSSFKKEIEVNRNDEVEKATNLFLLWNFTITASLGFYALHVYTNDYTYLFLVVLVMLLISWILLLMKLHDLAIQKHQSRRRFIMINFVLPIIGTFYSFAKLSKK
jgi:hypothetical protein